MAIATCHTPDCPNDGVPVDVETSFTDAVTGETTPVTAVVCGGCGVPIEDVDPPLDAAPDGGPADE